MQQANEIQFEQHDGVMLLDIQGDITAFSEPYLNEAYQKATQENATKMVLKFETDAYINSGGIAVLIQILAQTKKNGQLIGITGLSEHFVKIFNMVGITKFATIYDTVDSALQAFATFA